MHATKTPLGSKFSKRREGTHRGSPGWLCNGAYRQGQLDGPLSRRLAVTLFRAMEGYRNRHWRRVFCNGHGS